MSTRPPPSQDPPPSRPPGSSRPPRTARAKRTGALLRLTGTAIIVPPTCACCGEPAGSTEPIRAGSSELFVGYCEECARHLGTERTRKLAGGIASGLLGIALAAALPLSPYPSSALTLALLALGGALLPILAVALWPRVPAQGHLTVGPAVRFRRAGELVAASDRWALELARANDLKRERTSFEERRISASMLPALVIAPLLALGVRELASPVVRIVNLTSEVMIVILDGRTVARVEPTSLESPTAGTELRVASGPHEISALSLDGRVLERASVTVAAGRPHLFAPASAGFCFWLETQTYGRNDRGEEALKREPLDGPPSFWALPGNLGGFFLPAPAVGSAERRLTGGAVTVLRQGPCEAGSVSGAPERANASSESSAGVNAERDRFGLVKEDAELAPEEHAADGVVNEPAERD
jgi:hypothetical protein